MSWLRAAWLSPGPACAEVQALGGEGQILRPGPDQEKEVREGKVRSDAKKIISEGASCLAPLPDIPSRSMEQWHRYVRAKAVVMETSARKSGVKTVKGKKRG